MAVFGGQRLVLNRAGIGVHLRRQMRAENARQVQTIVERIERLAQNGHIAASAYLGSDAIAILDRDAFGHLKIAGFKRARQLLGLHINR